MPWVVGSMVRVEKAVGRGSRRRLSGGTFYRGTIRGFGPRFGGTPTDCWTFRTRAAAQDYIDGQGHVGFVGARPVFVHRDVVLRCRRELADIAERALRLVMGYLRPPQTSEPFDVKALDKLRQLYAEAEERHVRAAEALTRQARESQA